MAYTPPDRATLRAGVSRDLRDPANLTFTTGEVDDLLNAAIVEVSRVYPKEAVQEATVEEDGQSQYDIDAYSVFRVEVIKDGRVVAGIPPNTLSTSAEGGFDLHAGTLWLPYFASVGLLLEDSPTLRAWGYWPRELFAEDTDLLDGDAEVEVAVRAHAVLQGYQRLQNDRILFQQWITNTGNTDVSPNQLAQTADMYQSQWDTARKRLRRLQRV